MFFFAHSCIFVSPFLDDQPQKKSEDGDEPTNQPVDIMVNQYFRWRCELLDNRPIQGEFNKYNWKWWKMWDGYYDLNGEMIQLPRWMCYDQQLTVVKQKCKEFVKVAIQWNWLGLFSRKFKVFIFCLMYCLSWHILVFLFHHLLKTNHKMKWIRWWSREPTYW